MAVTEAPTVAITRIEVAVMGGSTVTHAISTGLC